MSTCRRRSLLACAAWSFVKNESVPASRKHAKLPDDESAPQIWPEALPRPLAIDVGLGHQGARTARSSHGPGFLWLRQASVRVALCRCAFLSYSTKSAGDDACKAGPPRSCPHLQQNLGHVMSATICTNCRTEVLDNQYKIRRDAPHPIVVRWAKDRLACKTCLVYRPTCEGFWLRTEWCKSSRQTTQWNRKRPRS